MTTRAIVLAAGGAALIGAVLSGRAAAIDPQPGTGIPAATVAFNNNDAAAAEQAWKTYTNTRYVVSVHYPAALFAMGEAPPDNAGRGFEAKDGARFSVYSSANALDQDPSALLAETLEEVSPDDLRDKTVAAAGFTVIFRRDGEVVQRHLSTSEQGTMLHWLEIGYPQSLETKYAPVAARMIASFASIFRITGCACPSRLENARCRPRDLWCRQRRHAAARHARPLRHARRGTAGHQLGCRDCVRSGRD